MTIGGLLKALGVRTRLETLLDDYPRYIRPYPGSGKMLTDDKARANLEHFLSVKDERLAAVTALLARFGLDARRAMTGDPKPFLKRLADWISRDWPAIRDAQQADYKTWHNGPRGGRADLTLIVDIAILLGEMLAARRPELSWQVMLGPLHRGASHWREIALTGEGAGIFSLEGAVHRYYAHCTGQHRRRADLLASDLHGLFYVPPPLTEAQLAERLSLIDAARPLYDSGFAFHGVRLRVAEAEMEDAELDQDRRQKAARDAGLDCRFERLPNERHYLFVGLTLAELSPDQEPPAFDDPETLQRRAETDERLRAAGFRQKSGLHIEWLQN